MSGRLKDDLGAVLKFAETLARGLGDADPDSQQLAETFQRRLRGVRERLRRSRIIENPPARNRRYEAEQFELPFNRDKP